MEKGNRKAALAPLIFASLGSLVLLIQSIVQREKRESSRPFIWGTSHPSSENHQSGQKFSHWFGPKGGQKTDC